MDAEERARLRARLQDTEVQLNYARTHRVGVPAPTTDWLARACTHLLDALDAAEARIAALTEESFNRTLAIDLGPDCGGEWGVRSLCEVFSMLGYPKTLEEAARVIERRVST